MNDKDFETKEKPIEDVLEETPVQPMEKPIEKVEEKKPEETIKPVTQAETPQRQTLTLVSETDAYIADRMKSQPKTVDEVAMLKPKRYEPGKHRLSLPEELMEYEDRFAFRWINKKKRALDDAIDVKGWVVINRALFPDLPEHLFASSGAIERGDTVLMFYSKERQKAYHADNALKAKRLRTSTAMLQKTLPEVEKGQAGFYKPKDTSADSEGGLQEGRDF